MTGPFTPPTVNGLITTSGRALLLGGAGLVVGRVAWALARTRGQRLLVGAVGAALLVAVGAWMTATGPAQDSLAGAAVIALPVLNGLAFLLGVLAVAFALGRSELR